MTVKVTPFFASKGRFCNHGFCQCGDFHMVPFKNPRNLLWAFAVNAEVKDALDNLGSILIQNPLVLAAGAALMQADTDFF